MNKFARVGSVVWECLALWYNAHSSIAQSSHLQHLFAAEFSHQTLVTRRFPLRGGNKTRRMHSESIGHSNPFLLLSPNNKLPPFLQYDESSSAASNNTPKPQRMVSGI